MVLRSEIIRQILENRGITAEKLEDYLAPSITKLAKPEELPGVVEAGEVLLSSIANGDDIVVFGDYDCDGVSATAILTRTLHLLGAKVAEFIPDRISEGYGMSDRAVERMLRQNPTVKMVVTVDNGINSVEPVAKLHERGIKVVITDHHLPGDELPKADALIDPKVAAPEHLGWLCGAGVAFMLANRLVCEAKRRGSYSGGSVAGPLLVMTGLATVTDIMPLLGQNRILVTEALKRFSTCAPMGLKALYNRASRSGYDKISSRDFGFMLGPRINAAGRMASGMEALELLSSDDQEIVNELARMVDGYNATRKMVEQEMAEKAMALVVPGASAQIIELPDGHQGIAGIVAARMMERLQVPIGVIACGHGSARAPAGINLRDAFVACADCLEVFGGHAAAGGFSVKPGKVDEFRRRICEYCDPRIAALAEEKAKSSPVDAWITFDDLTMDLAEDVLLMEPFGVGNEEPKFGIRGVYFSDIKPMGVDGHHLAVSFKRTAIRGVWWGHGDQVEQLRANSAVPHDIIFKLTVSDYGERHVEVRLESVD